MPSASGWRCVVALARKGATPVPKNAPAVTIVQPLCGVETFSRETLRSIFALDYPDYEVIFCLASADDPIAPLVRGAIASHPGPTGAPPDRRRSRQRQSQAQQCREGLEGGAPRLGDYRRLRTS